MRRCGFSLAEALALRCEEALEALDFDQAERAHEAQRLLTIRSLPYMQDEERRRIVGAWESAIEGHSIFEESEESKQARRDRETMKAVEAIRAKFVGR